MFTILEIETEMLEKLNTFRKNNPIKCECDFLFSAFQIDKQRLCES